MLYLQRNESESFVIKIPGGQSIIVKIDSFQRGGVRIGIDTDRQYKIHRGEFVESETTRPCA